MKRLFVIQEHEANRAGLHWDIRFETGGDTSEYISKRKGGTTPEPMTQTDKVLRSFAIPKHRFPEAGEKLLATPTEDHPWDYRNFEGVIPSGYGAGTVKLVFSDYINVIDFTATKICFEFDGIKYTMFPMKGKKFWLITQSSLK
jgi:hypothetical protein